MKTPITYLQEKMAALTMWVEARNIILWEKQGYDLVEYESPQEGWRGVVKGRMLIRKQGGDTIHRWSPELRSLHQHILKSWDSNHPGFENSRLIESYHEAHTAFFEGGYHSKVMVPLEGDCLEDVHRRVLLLMEGIRDRHGLTRKSLELLTQIHTTMGTYAYVQPVNVPPESE